MTKTELLSLILLNTDTNKRHWQWGYQYSDTAQRRSFTTEKRFNVYIYNEVSSTFYSFRKAKPKIGHDSSSSVLTNLLLINN
jgi:hypothetical protein